MGNFTVGIQVTILGMVVVFAILLLLYVSMIVMRRCVHTVQEEPPRRKMRPRPPSPEQPESEPEQKKIHDPKVIAAITAAVMAASEAEARPRVSALRLPQAGSEQWKAAGRMEGLMRFREG